MSDHFTDCSVNNHPASTHLSRLQLKIILEKLWEESPDPVIELVVLCLDHLDHEVHLLQARGEEVRAAGLVVEWTGSVTQCITDF